MSYKDVSKLIWIAQMRGELLSGRAYNWNNVFVSRRTDAPITGGS